MNVRHKGASPLARLALSVDSVSSGKNTSTTAPVVFEPLEQPCEAAVVFLHGFGDGPDSWAEGLAAERLARPRWKWLFLRGRQIPQTCYSGQKVQGWGDFLDSGLIDVGSADHESKDSRGCYKTTVASVHAAIDGLRTSDSLRASQIVLAGFSQGGACAALSALRYPRKLGGLLVLSGWLLPSARKALAAGSANREMRVFVSHGTHDNQVGFGCAEFSTRLLQEAGASVEFETQQGLNHELGQEAKLKAFRFLDDVLRPAADTCYRAALQPAKVEEPTSVGKRTRTISSFQAEKRARAR